MHAYRDLTSIVPLWIIVRRRRRQAIARALHALYVSPVLAGFPTFGRRRVHVTVVTHDIAGRMLVITCVGVCCFRTATPDSAYSMSRVFIRTNSRRSVEFARRWHLVSADARNLFLKSRWYHRALCQENATRTFRH